MSWISNELAEERRNTARRCAEIAEQQAALLGEHQRWIEANGAKWACDAIRREFGLTEPAPIPTEAELRARMLTIREKYALYSLPTEHLDRAIAALEPQAGAPSGKDAA